MAKVKISAFTGLYFLSLYECAQILKTNPGPASTKEENDLRTRMSLPVWGLPVWGLPVFRACPYLGPARMEPARMGPARMEPARMEPARMGPARI